MAGARWPIISEPGRPALDNHPAAEPCRTPRGAQLKGSRPEIELLLDASRVHLEQDDDKRVRTWIQGGLDWDDVLRLAHRNRVIPVLYRSLNAVGSGNVPPAVFDRVLGAFHQIAASNLRMTGELIRLLDLFEAHGIAAIPYKGPTLASLAYGNVSFRMFSDLDLLLRERDLAKARDLLTAEGFRVSSSLSPAQDAAYVTSIRQLPLVSPAGILVELHVEINPRDYGFPLDLDRLKERLLPVRLVGRNTLTFSVEDLVLVLCAHGERHWWGSLGWICDLAELIRTQRGVRWEWVLDEARRLHGQRLVLLGLALAGELLRAPIPEFIRARIQVDPAIPWLIATAGRWLFREGDDSPGASGRALFHFRARERWRDGARYCLSRCWSHASGIS
jgi:hypothetical protein